MRVKHLIILVVLLLAPISAASPAHAGGVVTVCDEAHLLAALAGGGIVTFACSGTITLSALIVISADTTINGSGQDVTISGNYVTRVFKVNPGTAFILIHLTVTKGYALTGGPSGGGIDNDGGTVTVVDSTFSDNHAYNDGGAIVNRDGTVTVDNSVFTGNGAHYAGGGIYNSGGSLFVSNTTLARNGVGYAGGGIYNDHGTVVVSTSTFLGNMADAGGGISNGGALTVSNSTFFGNQGSGFDGGGGIYTYGTAAIANSTFAGNSAAESNGAGIQSSGALTLGNTIVANSLAGSNCRGAITDGGGNVSYPDTTCPGINADPLLGPLQNNGGPTWTMALGPGSAAIDAGSDAICAANPVNNRDQRGVVRPQGAHCDIGAFERPGKWLPIMLVE